MKNVNRHLKHPFGENISGYKKIKNNYNNLVHSHKKELCLVKQSRKIPAMRKQEQVRLLGILTNSL